MLYDRSQNIPSSEKQHIFCITLKCSNTINGVKLIIVEKTIMHTVHYGKLGKLNENLTAVL